MSGTVNNNVYGATSVQSQQQEASILAFTVPPATQGSSFSFSISSAVGGPALGTITTNDPNLQVDGSTVTVLSGFTGPSTVTIGLTGATVPSATFNVISTGTAQNGTQTSLTVDMFGWFKVTTLGTGASFNALSYMVTGLPSNQNTQMFLPTPLFLISSVTGTDYSFTVGNTSKVTSGSVSLSLPPGTTGLKLSNNNTTVTANSNLTAGMRIFVTVTYTPTGQTQSTTTQFAIQRLSASGTGTASTISVGNNGYILVQSLPAGVYLRGNNVSYQTTSPGNYSISFLGIGVTFNTVAVTFNPSDSAFSFNLAPSGTSVTITDSNSSGLAPSTNFTLNTPLGSIDPQIVNNPDDDPRSPGSQDE